MFHLLALALLAGPPLLPDRPSAQAAVARMDGARATWRAGRSTPATLRVPPVEAAGDTAGARAASFVIGHPEVFGHDASTLQCDAGQHTARGTAVRCAVFCGGLRLDGAVLVVRLDAAGRVVSVASDSDPLPLRSQTGDIGQDGAIASAGPGRAASVSLVALPAGADAVAAYRVTTLRPGSVRPVQVFIEKATGTVLATRNRGIER